MRTPRIITGSPFDWKRGSEAAAQVMGEDGEINWLAAFSADPGVTKCPECGEYYWREGDRVACLDCGAEWNIP